MRKGLWRHVGLGGEEPSPTATINVHLGRETEGSGHCHLGVVSQECDGKKEQQNKKRLCVCRRLIPAREPTEFWLGVERVAEGQEKEGARMVVNYWLTVYSLVASVSHATVPSVMLLRTNEYIYLKVNA